MFKSISKEQKSQLNSIFLFHNINISIQSGWFNITKEYLQKISDYCVENNLNPTFQQVKSKFGSSCFYYFDETKNSYLKEIIQEFEQKLNNTCERCSSNQDVEIFIDKNLVVSLCTKCKTEEMQAFNSFKQDF